MTAWLPLESNPDVLTKYIHKLGVSKEWEIFDVVGLEPQMLEWVPQPVKSIILLFPISETYEKHRAQEHEKLSVDPGVFPDDLFYMRQLTSNACGTVALIHSLANSKSISLEDGILKSFLENVKDLTPEERGKALENDKSFTEGHHELAKEGQTVADPEEKVNHHFVALINKNGVLYELDGRKEFPIKHGPTTDETFIQDAAKVCKEFMARDPDELRFTVMALSSV
ncbi:ubiquitin carboxyl-terminal hydrolase isoform X1 [Anastrepha ludens]|uniref:ubiquitin carboxyl-terminal hydrolase isoform X1 n=1 Tax=Anastrepha ludens TaxID=28586 RepID=UPI0023AEB535|nr:ubiquitin carboxyl-terminal hydrolase isoform X1 [Anastrepha ludens]